ncbi:T9SS type A sorting domain-containing protein [uncultured Croceitalea sp.]|uniref:T9SS type A sorting domain-containing protein n=1 Tax=uncultured Croceitalea sp. TaxID=1798908 RepID=UPI003305ED07
MKQIQIDIDRNGLVQVIFVLLLLLSINTLQAQENTSRFEVRPGEPISAALKTLEVIYVLEAVVDQKEETLALNLSVYPNPTTSQLNVNIEQQGAIKQLFFYTMNGSRVSAPQLRSTAYSSTHDVARLPNGMYLVVIELENGERITKKIIKN